MGEIGNGGCETTCGDVGVSLIGRPKKLYSCHAYYPVQEASPEASKLDWGDYFLEMVHDEDFFLQMGLMLILATLDGLDVGLLRDVIGEDDCDDG
uniref:Uncharacterized protein n=1 Tax=Tanacetum cinerariifolium TaxID=118510 RepID=A0A699RXU2_TANCI|nr:hypothetical protein [Tanacetum cinerariifolium]